MTILNTLIPALVALISGSGAYLIARRQNSGKIDTTEAAVLWQQSQVMRKELRDEVVDLKEQLTEARSEISTLRSRIVVLEGKHE